MKKCVFAGTFDPPTLGHKDIVLQCRALFDEVIVAILINPNNKPLFSVDARLALLQKVFAPSSDVRAFPYVGLMADLLPREEAQVDGRGIRKGPDYE